MNELQQRNSPALLVEDLVFTRTNRHTGESFHLGIKHFRVEPGEIVTLMGPSGAGKSTLVQLLGLNFRPDSVSTFHMAGTDVRALWQNNQRKALEALRRKWLGFALQRPELLSALTVEENIAVPLHLNGQGEVRTRVRDLLEKLSRRGDDGEFDLLRVRKNRPHHISGGQAQRVGLARALAHRPAIVVADEPTANLDWSNACRAMEFLRGVSQVEKAAVVLVTHDPQIAQQFADRTYQLGPLESGGNGIINQEEATDTDWLEWNGTPNAEFFAE